MQQFSFYSVNLKTFLVIKFFFYVWLIFDVLHLDHDHCNYKLAEQSKLGPQWLAQFEYSNVHVPVVREHL